VIEDHRRIASCNLVTLSTEDALHKNEKADLAKSKMINEEPIEQL